MQLKSFYFLDSQITCDTSMGTIRPDTSFRKIEFLKLHNLSYPGVRASIKLVKQRFVWPSIEKDCRNWAQQCLACQSSKIQQHTRSPVKQFATPSARFKHIHIDLVGPLPISHGYEYCLTCIDRYTRWPEAIPLSNIRASTVAHALLHGWIARFGIPAVITSGLAKLLGSQHIHTTAWWNVITVLPE